MITLRKLNTESIIRPNLQSMFAFPVAPVTSLMAVFSLPPSLPIHPRTIGCVWLSCVFSLLRSGSIPQPFHDFCDPPALLKMIDQLLEKVSVWVSKHISLWLDSGDALWAGIRGSDAVSSVHRRHVAPACPLPGDVHFNRLGKMVLKSPHSIP